MRRLITVTTVGDLIDAAARRWTHDALVFPERRVSFRELGELTTGYARSLHGLGLRPGDKLGVLMPNCLDYVLLWTAATKLGAVAVPINGRFKAHELSYVIPHADIGMLVTSVGPTDTTDFPALVADVLGAAPLLREVIDFSEVPQPGFLSRAQFVAAGDDVSANIVDTLAARVRVRDPAILMYTSGTTAAPKGCLLSHEAVVRQGAAVASTRFALSPDDRMWDPLPLFHCGGIVPMLGCLSAGATFYHAGHFEPGQSLETLWKERVTIAYPAFDTIWMQILQHPRYPEADLSALRTIMSIATPERLAQFEQAMPWAKQISSYGSTEGATNLTLSHPDDPYEARMRTLGGPIEGLEIRIAALETGEDLECGAIGELCFRGYCLFSGYYKDPAATAAAIDADGWFHTEDLGALDQQGRFIYAGRLKDMLKVGGENVSALEVEDYLVRHPAVAVAQVVAAPDEKYGEVPVAFIQLRPGRSVSEQELIAFCDGSIARYKVPRHVRTVEEWPMSGTKIQKFVLRERIATELTLAGQAG